MKKERFYQITHFLADLIKGTEFEHHVYAVGGAVRDLLMGNEIKDIDLVIDLPDGGTRLADYFGEMRYSFNNVVYPTYGTAMFHLNAFPDEEIECVMTRGEKYVDKNSRNPVCVFDTIEADAVRRDLTINAIYYNVTTGEIYDPTGGEEDIKNCKPVRTTNNNPDVVFDDDALRILRVARFATKYNLGIEDKTYESMVKYVDRLGIISKERIQTELNKILCCKNATYGIRTLMNIGAMKYIIPELEETVGLEQNKYHFGDVFEHTMALIDHYHNVMISKGDEPDLVTLIALLLHDIGKILTRSFENGSIHFYEHEHVGTKMIVDILKELKYDNDTIKEVQFLVKNHMRTKNFGDNMEGMKPKSFNKLAYECGNKERYLRLATVIECDNQSHSQDHLIHGHFDKMVSCLPMAEKMFGYKLPISGDDVMNELGIKPGRDVKLVLDRLMKTAFRVPNIKRDSCLKQIKFIYKQIQHEKTKKN